MIIEQPRPDCEEAVYSLLQRRIDAVKSRQSVAILRQSQDRSAPTARAAGDDQVGDATLWSPAAGNRANRNGWWSPSRHIARHGGIWRLSSSRYDGELIFLRAAIGRRDLERAGLSMQESLSPSTAASAHSASIGAGGREIAPARFAARQSVVMLAERTSSLSRSRRRASPSV